MLSMSLRRTREPKRGWVGWAISLAGALGVWLALAPGAIAAACPDAASPAGFTSKAQLRKLTAKFNSFGEATLRQLAGEKVSVTVLYPPIASPPSPLPAPFLATLERLAAAQWPGVPLAPVMEAGATDGMYTRLAGIPTYGASALPEDPDDVRAHGRDERVGVETFYEATEFWYRTIRAFGEER